MFNNLINIIASPVEAFTSLKEKPSALLPLALIVLLAASLQWGYFHIVDRDFLVDQLVEQTMNFVSNVPERQIREGIEGRSSNAMAIQSVVSIIIIVPLILSLYSGYLTLISKFTLDDIGFKRWFSLTCWTGIPAIFGVLAGWVVLLSSSDGMVTLQDIKPLSLNNLIFQLEGTFKGLLSNIDLTQIWSLVLMILGYMKWTGKNAVKATLIVAGPYIVILGIALVVILT